MSFHQVDIASLLGAVSWPLITALAIAVFRRPLGNLFAVLGKNVRKFSIAGFSIEIAQVPEMKPRAMDQEIRQLEAGLVPQSGTNSLTTLVNELQAGGNHDYVVIDFGSESSPRWLTSRLYLLCFLINLINRQLCMVFVETVGDVRKRFVGTTSPDRVRWALARRYGWLESAAVGAYAMQAANAPFGYLPTPTPRNQFDPETGFFLMMIPNLIQQFLASIRSTVIPSDLDKSEWVSLDRQQTYEHAKWVNGDRIERLLGSELSSERVTLPPNTTVNGLADPVLAQTGRFIAVIAADGTFRSLVDRQEVLDGFAHEFLRQASAGQN